MEIGCKFENHVVFWSNMQILYVFPMTKIQFYEVRMFLFLKFSILEIGCKFENHVFVGQIMKII